MLARAGIFLAAQCCEHLNRALILEREAARLYRARAGERGAPAQGGRLLCHGRVGGLRCPAAVEHVRAKAGIDIGDTLIGMHLCEVAVPVRIQVKRIGEANVVCARTRPKFIGGARAHYDEDLL